MNQTEDLISEEVDILERLSGMPVDLLSTAVTSNIWRASQAFRRKMEAEVLREQGLTFASFSTLYIVWIWGPIEMSAIAKSQNVSRPTITSTVGLLEKRGLCQRVSGGNGDGRSVLVNLMPQGKELIEDVYPIFNKSEKSFVSGLTEEECLALTSLLRKLVKSNSAL